MPKKIPMRSCTGCGSRKEKKSLIRVVHTPDGRFVLDTTGRAQGRGAYLCPDPACLELARKKHALSRSFGCEVPGEVYDALAAQLQSGKGGGDG